MMASTTGRSGAWRRTASERSRLADAIRGGKGEEAAGRCETSSGRRLPRDSFLCGTLREGALVERAAGKDLGQHHDHSSKLLVGQICLHRPIRLDARRVSFVPYGM